jgi:hypothetical protein
MRISTRGLRAAFLALGVLLMAGMVTACDDSGGAGDAAPPPAQN